MEWVQDMTDRWVRIMSAAGGGQTPLDEAVRQVSVIGEAVGAMGRLGWGRREAGAGSRGLAEASAVTALSRQLVAGVLVSDLVIDRLCAIGGQTREQVLAQACEDLPRQMADQQLRVLQAELSGSCAQLQGPAGASYAGLGSRIEQLLKLAEQQAAALIDAARAEAAAITASAGARPPAHGAPEADRGEDRHGG